MRYNSIIPGIFLERPNRFIAYIDINGKKETVHVKNTGRCAELLRPGARVYLQESDNPDQMGSDRGGKRDGSGKRQAGKYGFPGAKPSG